jgi:hypothetical protein
MKVDSMENPGWQLAAILKKKKNCIHRMNVPGVLCFSCRSAVASMSIALYFLIFIVLNLQVANVDGFF